MSRLKIAVMVVGSFLTASCAHLEALTSTATQPATMAGVWEGVGIQSPAEDTPSWPMRIVLDPRGDGAVTYPTLNCGGPLTRVGRRGEGVVYREAITTGAENCISGGTVTLIPANGKMFWYWTGENSDDPEVNASAVLVRTGG